MAKNTGGLSVISSAIDNAQPAGNVGKAKAGANDYDETNRGLPPGCPIVPLGKLGQTCYYLDEQNQLIELGAEKHQKSQIRSLFGRQSELCDKYWPRLDQHGQPKGPDQWHPEIAANVLQRASAWAGIFDPHNHVFGRGAHSGKNGELILHCGDVIFIAGDSMEYQEPGKIGEFVYPTAKAIPRPHEDPQDSGAGEEILALLKTWYWSRPLVDPMLLLGWTGCALIAGALPWRPHVWVTGSSATGKSTLQKALEYLFDGGALQTADATEASLRQLTRQQTLPILFDEIEAAEDNRKNKAVINLARLSSSGSEIFRGGQDHTGHAFKARTCFLFSSILIPPALQQDRNRLAILELERIPTSADAVDLEPERLRELGRRLRRRLVDQWSRLEQLLAKYRSALAAVGHGSRGQDQFGTLLAVADLLLYDTADEETVEAIASWLKADELAEKAMELADEEEAVAHLATSTLRGRGGDEPQPVARLIRASLEPDGNKSIELLENYGLRVVEPTVSESGAIGGIKPRPETPRTELAVAIANSHTELAKIFERTRWSEGTWAQAFARVEGARKRAKIRFGPGNAAWSTLIPLSSIIELENVD